MHVQEHPFTGSATGVPVKEGKKLPHREIFHKRFL
jgi:hypothetical protein